jgi:hypothetical protein
MGLSFTIATGPPQRSNSRVRVPRDSLPYFTISDSRLPKPGGPGPRIYIPPGTGWSSNTPGTWFPFRRILRVAGLRWSYSTPPPHGVLTLLSQSRVRVTLRLTVYCRSIRLGDKPLETHDQQFYFSTEYLRHRLHPVIYIIYCISYVITVDTTNKAGISSMKTTCWYISYLM